MKSPFLPTLVRSHHVPEIPKPVFHPDHFHVPQQRSLKNLRSMVAQSAHVWRACGSQGKINEQALETKVKWRYSPSIIGGIPKSWRKNKKKIVLTIEHFSKNQASVPTNGIQRFARFSHFFTVTTAKKRSLLPTVWLDRPEDGHHGEG